MTNNLSMWVEAELEFRSFLGRCRFKQLLIGLTEAMDRHNEAEVLACKKAIKELSEPSSTPD